jgi:hypothetical protein
MPTWEGPKFTADVTSLVLDPCMSLLTAIKQIAVPGYTAMDLKQWSGVDASMITHHAEWVLDGLLVVNSTDVYLFAHIVVDSMEIGAWAIQNTPLSNGQPFNAATGKIDVTSGTWYGAESSWVVPK